MHVSPFSEPLGPVCRSARHLHGWWSSGRQHHCGHPNQGQPRLCFSARILFHIRSVQALLRSAVGLLCIHHVTRKSVESIGTPAPRFWVLPSALSNARSGRLSSFGDSVPAAPEPEPSGETVPAAELRSRLRLYSLTTVQRLSCLRVNGIKNYTLLNKLLVFITIFLIFLNFFSLYFCIYCLYSVYVPVHPWCQCLVCNVWYIFS